MRDWSSQPTESNENPIQTIRKKEKKERKNRREIWNWGNCFPPLAFILFELKQNLALFSFQLAACGATLQVTIGDWKPRSGMAGWDSSITGADIKRVGVNIKKTSSNLLPRYLTNQRPSTNQDKSPAFKSITFKWMIHRVRIAGR